MNTLEDTDYDNEIQRWYATGVDDDLLEEDEDDFSWSENEEENN